MIEITGELVQQPNGSFSIRPIGGDGKPQSINAMLRLFMKTEYTGKPSIITITITDSVDSPYRG